MSEVPTAVELEVRRQAGALGALITGVDLSRPVGDDTFATRCNTSMVTLEPVLPEAEQTKSEAEHAAAGKGRLLHTDRCDEIILRDLVERHLRYTGSTLALAILDDWDTARGKFVKVFPNEYRRALTELYTQAATRSAEGIRQKAAA